LNISIERYLFISLALQHVEGNERTGEVVCSNIKNITYMLDLFGTLADFIQHAQAETFHVLCTQRVVNFTYKELGLFVCNIVNVSIRVKIH